MFRCVVCWGCKLVLDPFVPILEYMQVVEVWFACFGCLEGLGGLFVHEAEFWMNSGSAAEARFDRRTP